MYVLFTLEDLKACVVGSGTMLEAGRSWVRFPMRALNFFQFTYSL
jgi:hypothetical protein